MDENLAAQFEADRLRLVGSTIAEIEIVTDPSVVAAIPVQLV